MQRRAGVPASISLIVMGLLVVLVLARRYFINPSFNEAS